ncbi:pyruvate kinase PKM-like isoform X2 [Haliotis rubra]|uniref:pyruvate kinase PKM-like isoform X2 n=1 Tax=Haliotis rubra TaxID=36100 RepID=UPI001EE60CC1|nr:pyruvate kinase PKM-like isoform X2 [Haliotis rubra]
MAGWNSMNSVSHVFSGSYKMSGSRLQHMCQLDIDADCHALKRTSVICCIGPSCDSVDILQQLIEKGVNICCINMAHGSQQQHRDTVDKIREAESLANKKLPKRVAIAIDISGPAIHIGKLRSELGGSMVLKGGDEVRLTGDATYRDSCDAEHIYVDRDELIRRAVVGDTIFLEDGPLSITVKHKGPGYLDCTVETEGVLQDYDECHLPGMLSGKQTLADKDVDDIVFALRNEIDMIFISWVWSSRIVQLVRRELGIKADEVKVIAKIENYEGVKRYDEILKVSDGTIVARGNLGVDLPPEKVFLAQKLMIGRARRAGKPVICASQMLQSMVRNPRPTRAEAGDVANAILDGVDCVMLSGETAIGKHPIKAVETLVAVCQESEAAVATETLFRTLRQVTTLQQDYTHTVARTAVETAIRSGAAAILILTSSGRSASLIAHYRPPCHIVAITRAPQVARSLNLHWGMLPVLYEEDEVESWAEDIDRRIHHGILISADHGIIKTGDMIALVTGMSPGSGFTNSVRLLVVPELDKLQPITNIL